MDSHYKDKTVSCLIVMMEIISGKTIFTLKQGPWASMRRQLQKIQWRTPSVQILSKETETRPRVIKFWPSIEIIFTDREYEDISEENVSRPSRNLSRNHQNKITSEESVQPACALPPRASNTEGSGHTHNNNINYNRQTLSRPWTG